MVSPSPKRQRRCRSGANEDKSETLMGIPQVRRNLKKGVPYSPSKPSTSTPPNNVRPSTSKERQSNSKRQTPQSSGRKKKSDSAACTSASVFDVDTKNDDSESEDSSDLEESSVCPGLAPILPIVFPKNRTDDEIQFKSQESSSNSQGSSLNSQVLSKRKSKDVNKKQINRDSSARREFEASTCDESEPLPKTKSTTRGRTKKGKSNKSSADWAVDNKSPQLAPKQVTSHKKGGIPKGTKKSGKVSSPSLPDLSVDQSELPIEDKSSESGDSFLCPGLTPIIFPGDPSDDEISFKSQGSSSKVQSLSEHKAGTSGSKKRKLTESSISTLEFTTPQTSKKGGNPKGRKGKVSCTSIESLDTPVTATSDDTPSSCRRISPREDKHPPQPFIIELHKPKKRGKKLAKRKSKPKGSMLPHDLLPANHFPSPDEPMIINLPGTSKDYDATPRRKSNPPTRRKNEATPPKVINRKDLLDSAGSGNVIRLEGLLKDTDSQEGVFKELFTAGLFVSLKNGHKRVVQLLVKHGADINAHNSDGLSTLHMAVAFNRPDLVKYLHKRGAQVTLTDGEGSSVLLSSVKSQQSLDLIKYLIHTGGANVNDQDSDGTTAAMITVVNYDFDMLKLLIDNKADLNITDNKGCTVFSIAALKNTKHIVELLNSKHSKQPSFLLLRAITINCVRTVSMLLDCDFMDVNSAVYRGSTGLNLALSKGKHASYDIVKELLNYGADIEKEDQDGCKPLAVAATSARLDLVQLLLDRGAKINAKSRMHNMTALMHAAKKGHVKIVECLIDNRAVLNLRDDLSYTALTHALSEGRLDCIRLLLNKKAVVHRATDLQAAVFNNHTEATRVMLELMSPKELESTLLFSAVEDDCVDIARLLIKHGADVNGINFLQETPLMRVPSAAMAHLLLDHGAELNRQSHFEGRTALMEAANMASYRDTEIVATLIERGADVNLVDAEGTTALILAALGTNPEAAHVIIEAGADLNKMSKRNLSALMAASQRGMSSVVEALLQKSVDVNAKSAKDETALMFASMNSHCSIVKLLIEYDAQVNLPDLDGNTALMMTTTVTIGNMLITAGAEVNLSNKDGKSALMLVLESVFCDSDLVQALISNHARVFVLNAQKTKSPLSSLLRKQVLTSSDYICLKELLKAGAARMGAPYHCPAAPLVKLILLNKPTVIQTWVASGAPPAMVCNNCLVKERCCTHAVSALLQECGVTELSPFVAALFTGNMEIAQHFMNILFLTSSDVNGEIMQRGVRNVLEKLRQPKSVDLLDKFFSTPLTLKTLSFVSTSSFLKTGPDRAEYVRGTELPADLQEGLMFKPNTSQPSLVGPDSDTLFSDVLNYTASP